MMAWELKQIIMRRMSDDGGGDCSIVTGGEIRIFFFLLDAGKKVSSVFVIIGKREMVEVDYRKHIVYFFHQDE